MGCLERTEALRSVHSPEIRSIFKQLLRGLSRREGSLTRFRASEERRSVAGRSPLEWPSLCDGASRRRKRTTKSCCCPPSRDCASEPQANQLLKFQWSGSAWLAPVVVSVPKIQDVARSADGTVLLVATDTAMMEFDPATLTALGTYPVLDNLVNSGKSYLQSLAVANDGYAFVTTGGANPSHEFLYSPTRHIFIALTSANTSPAASLSPELYFGNPGVSGDGSLMAITQDPRSTAQNPMSSRPFLYVYDTGGQRSFWIELMVLVARCRIPLAPLL
jgi:hypothetical protein